MITIFGSTIGALWPWFLASIPLGGALLVYLFRAKGTAHPRITSSLFLLQKLPEYLPSRKRFIPPLQFWLELLACIILALAVSGVFSTDTGERIAVLIDNSKSMAALQPSGDSRLESARRIAESDISTSPNTTRFTVLAANSLLSLSPVSLQSSQDSTQRPTSPSAARKAVQEIAQSFEADRLQSTLDLLASSRQYDAVWVYTDKERADQTINPKVKIITIPSDARALSNAWIESLSLKSPSDTAAASQTKTLLQVKVAAVGPSAQAMSVSATCTDEASGSSYSLPSSSLSIRPSTSSNALLGPLDRAWSYCRVQLRPQDSSARDVLAIDDEAWIANSSTPSQLAVFSALSPQELGLREVPYSILEGRTLSDSERVTHAIYHRVLPQTSSKAEESPAPTIPSVLVMPPAGSRLWSNGAVSPSTAKALQVTRWDSSHPLLQYVQPGLLSIPSASLITCPDSAKAILHSSAGALVCAGEERGVRYVITGFELFPFDGLRSPTVSIFTLNVLRWLFSSDSLSPGSTQANKSLEQSGALNVGPLVLPPDTTSARMVAPQELSLTQGESRSALIPAPGIVAIRKQGVGSQGELLLAANSLSADESDISRRNTLRSPPALADSPQGDKAALQGVADNTEKTFFEQTLILLLLAVLLADLIRRIATRSRWGSVA
jgi:hypothetical protein